MIVSPSFTSSSAFVTLTNKVLARLNEVQLTSTSFATARGIQVQAQNGGDLHVIISVLEIS